MLLKLVILSIIGLMEIIDNFNNVHNIDIINNSKYLSILFFDTVNWLFPLIIVWHFLKYVSMWYFHDSTDVLILMQLQRYQRTKINQIRLHKSSLFPTSKEIKPRSGFVQKVRSESPVSICAITLSSSHFIKDVCWFYGRPTSSTAVKNETHDFYVHVPSWLDRIPNLLSCAVCHIACNARAFL